MFIFLNIFPGGLKLPKHGDLLPGEVSGYQLPTQPLLMSIIEDRGHYGQNIHIEDTMGQNIHIEDTMGRIYIERTLWAEYTYR